MNKRRVNITYKLSSTYLAIISAALISGIFCLYTLFKYQAIDKEMVLVNIPCISEVEKTQEISNEINKLTKNWVFLSNLSDRTKTNALVKNEYATAFFSLSKIAKKCQKTEDKRHFLAIKRNSKKALDGIAELNNIVADFESFYDEEKVNRAAEIYQTKIESSLKKNQSLFSELLISKNKRQKIIFEEKLNLIDYLTIIVFCAIASIVFISIASIFYTDKKISSPLIDLKNIISKVTAGDIETIAKSNGNDEIADMHNEISTLVDSLIEKTAFAKEIGIGNYFSEINILSDKDKLGYSLVDMSFELQKNNLQTKSSQESLKNAQKTAKIGSWEYELNTKKLSWSDEMYAIFEITTKNSLEELITAYKSKIHPDDKKTLSTIFKQTSITGEDFTYEHRILLQNGQIKYVFGKGTCEKNKLGKTIRIKGIVQDISSQKKTEQQIKDLIIFQNSILNSTEQSIISTDVNGLITQFNSGAEKILGYSAEEIINIQNPGIFHDPAEVVARAEVLSNELNKTVEPGFDVFISKANIFGSDTNEWTYITKNGNRIPVELIVTSRRNENNEIIGYTGVASDMSVKKAQFNEINLLKNALDETSLVSIANEKGIIEMVNEKFCLVSGYSQEELLGQNHRILNSGFHDKAFFIDLWKTISNGAIWRNEVQNRSKKGDIYWVHTTIVPVLNENNKPTQYISIRQDITERKHFEEVIINQKRIAEELTMAKDEFMSSMSHEIRTPLNGIIGFTNILLNNSNLTEQQNKQLEAIKTSGDILLVIINDILDIAKIESGKMNLEETPLQLKDLSQLILDTFAVKINEKQLNIHFEVDSNLPSNLLGDSVRISQILFNLLSNAIKFTTQGGTIALEIKSKHDSDLECHVELIVKDSGIGIPEDKINSVFEPFVQTSDDTARKYGGTGLGLTIVKKIIDLMHGEIRLTSEFGIGTTFTVLIPFKKNLKKDEIKPVTGLKLEEKAGDKLEAPRTLRILLAEDNLINQLLAQTVLEQFNYEVTTVENGLLAVEAVQEGIYDIVLMDLMMPEMDGYEASEKIRKLTDITNAGIPIIAVSADVTNSVINKCKEIGINDYISKPFDSEILKEKIIQLTRENL
jgi:PAS domain S-box-containing protein